MLAQAVLAADGVATLRELLNNTNRSDVVSLDQGYSGEYSKIYEEVPVGIPRVAEFTHAWFNHRGVAHKSAAAPTIAIGASRKGADGQATKSFRALATYKETIPDFEDLKRMPRIEDFESSFGRFRGIADGWGYQGEKHSSLSWLAFTFASGGGSIRVVSVFLHTVNKGNGWEIEKRDIRDGVFHPTGHPPIMEIEKTEPDGAANGTQPIRPQTKPKLPAPGSRR